MGNFGVRQFTADPNIYGVSTIKQIDQVQDSILSNIHEESKISEVLRHLYLETHTDEFENSRCGDQVPKLTMANDEGQ